LNHKKELYTADVSKYVLGWVLGTEWWERVVNVTNVRHNGMPPFRGTYVEATPAASPFESWLAMMLEKVRRYTCTL